MIRFAHIPLKDFIKKHNPPTPTTETIEKFEKEINSLLENAPRQDDEEFQKNEINSFLKNTYGYRCNTNKKVDSAIYVDGEVRVLIEVKALNNRNEFPKNRENPLSKAFCQMVLYFLEETEENNSLKHAIICNMHEFFLFDCRDLLFLEKDKRINKFYENYAKKEGTDSSKPKFYQDLEQFLQEDFQGELRYTYFNLSDDFKELPLIYQVLSHEVLLKQRKTLDANTLNKDFYEELLYILGLEEKNDKGKILIKPSRTQNSLSYALKEQYKNLDDEEVMALLIAWNNRILFLRLLESLLISFKHFEKPFLTTENFKDFNALNTLFFEVLAKKNSERSLKENNLHQIQKELFELKKDIIENCLFGVDINPNSCEITKLRLWIELLKYSYYIFEKGKNTNNLETLPNIDINIKCANSLISRFALKDKALLKTEKNKNLEYYIAEYKELVKIYKDPKILESLTRPIKDSNAVRKYAKERLYQELAQNPNKDFKKALNDRIEKIKEAFKLTLEPPQKELKFKKFLKEHLELYGKSILEEANDNGLELEALALEKQMAHEGLFHDYTPYPKLDKSDKVVGLEHFNRYVLTSYKDLQDENERYTNALEWRFEFPEVLDDDGNFLGFDCIIGNPPYIRQEHIKDLKPLLQKQYQDFYNSTADIYTYFFALAYHLLKEKGFSAFITSNKYARAKYGAKLRELLLKKTTLVSYMELNALKVFESATVDTSIMNFIKQPPPKESDFKYYEPTENDKENLKSTPSLPMKQNALSTESFIFANTTLLDLRDKIESVGTPLKDWNIQINYGIKTGANEAFIIPTEKRDEILKNCDDLQKDERGMSERERTKELIKPILRGKRTLKGILMSGSICG